MNRDNARRLLETFDFERLFAEQLLWNRHRAHIPVEVEGEVFDLRAIAEKSGVQVYLCPPRADGSLPPYALAQKIDRALARHVREHLLIFSDAARSVQVWQWVAREPGKPAQFRRLDWRRGQSADLLLEKLGLIAFRLEDDDSLLTVLGVAGKLRDAFDKEKLTKRFYDGFKLEREAFVKFILGIPDLGDHAWYASVMINRLMFVYFLQRKQLPGGAYFLDNHHDYLRALLDKSRAAGEDRFYRDALCPLFFGGFALPKGERGAELSALLGDIPYLNGGLFRRHQLEEDPRYHGRIEIPDAAFEQLFSFFDGWDWHLDERPIADKKGREINPDVLGYIFEKYVNQKQMGAYYTKEDITGYICRNSILPCLLDKVRAREQQPFEAAWALLAEEPDRYIWPAMRQGHWAGAPRPWGDGGEWRQRDFPAEIAAGLDPEQPDLIARRKTWNRPAAPEYALPTEIWRETVARRQRYLAVRARLAAGEVRAVNDLVTLNLDIGQFTQDLIAHSEDPALVRAVWRALTGVVPGPGASQRAFEYGLSVLDPTCGSGAFLFAALNILEPVYEACLERMEAFVVEAALAGEQQKFPDFRRVLDDVASRPNRRYFIYKSIVVHNLYGVDIMEEATEIAKLRLFLKLVAQLERKDQIEPLPDIDFNIRAGNTLVGFARYDEVQKAVSHDTQGQGKLLFDDPMKLIEQDANLAERAFLRFRQQQVAFGGEVVEEDKAELRRRLDDLDGRLDGYLAREYGIDPSKAKAFEKWRKSHQPFHWFVDFYGIMKAGGFDAVVGNPPWREAAAARKEYALLGYQTESCGNLYGLCIERAFQIRNKSGHFSFIVQLPLASSDRMAPVRALLRRHCLHVVPFDDRPGKLFEGLEHCRSVIFFAAAESSVASTQSVARYQRWASAEREWMLQRIEYVADDGASIWPGQHPKLASRVMRDVFAKITERGKARVAVFAQKSEAEHFVFYQEATQYWVKAASVLPHYARDGVVAAPAHGRYFWFAAAETAAAVSALLNSSLFYAYFIAYSDCFHLSDALAGGFPLPAAALEDERLVMLNTRLMADLRAHAERKSITLKKTGEVIEYDEYAVSQSKEIIDEIDQVLAEHYGLTEEELDAVINYDIKYRLGREALNG